MEITCQNCKTLTAANAALVDDLGEACREGKRLFEDVKLLRAGIMQEAYEGTGCKHTNNLYGYCIACEMEASEARAAEFERDCREMARLILARSLLISQPASWEHAYGPDLLALARKYAEKWITVNGVRYLRDDLTCEKCDAWLQRHDTPGNAVCPCPEQFFPGPLAPACMKIVLPEVKP